MRLHNLKAWVVRRLQNVVVRCRPIRRPLAPWAPIDAWAHGLVRINGRWFDLGFELPFRTPNEWNKMWAEYIKDCWSDS
jgi:hypothetical protein